MIGMEEIDVLIMLLSRTTDKNQKAVILQNYIAEIGLIPDDRAEEVRAALNGEEKSDGSNKANKT